MESISTMLDEMEMNAAYNTKEGFVHDKVSLQSKRVSFKTYHLVYLERHPYVNPEHYMANLRTMLKIR